MLKKIKTDKALFKILSSPDHSNKSWITDQYDQVVMCDTIQKSGGDAAVVRVHKKEKAISKEVHALHGVELSWQKIKKKLNRKIQGMPQHAF